MFLRSAAVSASVILPSDSPYEEVGKWGTSGQTAGGTARRAIGRVERGSF
jgi:hypothetical protein